MNEIIFLNGKFVAQQDARLSVLEPGFLYGWGVFETMRAYNQKIVYLDAHLKRLKSSCSLIDMKLPYPLVKLKKIIKNVVEKCRISDIYIRLTLSKSSQGTNIFLVAKKYQPHSFKKYRKGFSACICPFRQNENSKLAHLKTTNYLFYQLAYLKAKHKGFDEAIILNSRGFITEASRSNIFFIKNKELFTPSLDCGVLAGITRKVVFDLARIYNLKIYEGKFTIYDLDEADEAFLTNALMGIMPLVSVEGKLIAKGALAKLSSFFIKKYNLLLRGRDGN